MSKNYDNDFKHKIVLLHLQEGRTVKSLHEEYGIAKSTVSQWCEVYQQECQDKANENPDSVNEYTLMKENAELKKKLAEIEKENLFLKKAACFVISRRLMA